MGRAIIKGETIPLERFADEFKRRAQMVAVCAVELTVEVPFEARQVLEAPDRDLWVIQLRQKIRYKELDAWAKKQIDSL